MQPDVEHYSKSIAFFLKVHIFHVYVIKCNWFRERSKEIIFFRIFYFAHVFIWTLGSKVGENTVL